MKTTLLIIVILLSCFARSLGQVSDINNNLEKDKKQQNEVKSQSGTSSENANSNVFFGFFVDVFAATIGAAQRASLQNTDIYPERVSFESYMSIGTDFNFSNLANQFQVGVRGNWGIFGTDFRYFNLNDPTGFLGVIDWKVLVLRIPIKGFKIDYGIGFMNVQPASQTYFSSSIGFDWRLPNSYTNISSKYNWTERSNLGSRFNTGFNIKADTEVYAYRKIHLSPSLEYSYQNYFNETDFSLISVGLIFRIY